MGEHTKTPWKLKHKIDPTAVSGVTRSAGFDAVIANCGGWSSNKADPDEQRNEQVANAEFICLAVNNHDALVVALKNAIAECCEHNAEYHHRTSEADLNDWRELVKSASPGMDSQGGKVEE